MDRFLRYNRGGTAGVSAFGSQGVMQPTIVVQPSEPPPIPAFIQNQSLEARVACDPSNLPAIEATVRGRPVIRSDFGDGTNGYTTLRSPDLNSSITAGPNGLLLETPGIGPQRVLTCTDPEGRAEWQTPTQLLSPVDPVQCYIKLGNYDIEMATNWDQPVGKMRIKIQPFSAPGQLLTAQDENGTCLWQDPAPFPPIPPTPSIYASNVNVPLNTTPTILYPGVLLESTASDWSVTVDTTARHLQGQTNLGWQLFNTLGVAVGAVTNTPGGSQFTYRLVYQFVFRRVSASEVRMTATAIMQSGNSMSVTVPVENVAINPLDGMPMPRMAKANGAAVLNVVSRNAYYNVLNWVPVVAAAFRMDPDPFAGVVEVEAFEDVAVVEEAVANPEFIVAEETETVAAAEATVLSSAPPIKRQRRA